MRALNRRSFLKVAGSATAGTALGAKVYALAAPQDQTHTPASPNDHIQIALIGAGGQGMGDTRAFALTFQMSCFKWLLAGGIR